MASLLEFGLDICDKSLLGYCTGASVWAEFGGNYGEEVEVGDVDDLMRRAVFRSIDQSRFLADDFKSMTRVFELMQSEEKLYTKEGRAGPSVEIAKWYLQDLVISRLFWRIIVRTHRLPILALYSPHNFLMETFRPQYMTQGTLAMYSRVHWWQTRCDADLWREVLILIPPVPRHMEKVRIYNLSNFQRALTTWGTAR